MKEKEIWDEKYEKKHINLERSRNYGRSQIAKRKPQHVNVTHTQNQHYSVITPTTKDTSTDPKHSNTRNIRELGCVKKPARKSSAHHVGWATKVDG